MKIMTVVGARPQFVKAAVLSRAIAGRPELHEVMVHTGQHFDENMSDVFFSELGISAPQFNLGIHGGGHGAMTGQMMVALEPVMTAVEPDFVVVFGDTNSTLAGAVVAAKLNLPVAHVEAGLRSFNRAMPEEINRLLTDHLSTLLFCPTSTAVSNLRAEGVRDGVHAVGDVMYDACLFARERADRSSTILDRLGLQHGDYTLATVHRAENTDDPGRMRCVFAMLSEEALERTVVLPLHPRTRAAVARFDLTAALEDFLVIDPVGYLDMARLLSGCAHVITDSGGIQKEAYFNGKTCLTLRNETEWVETVEAGWNRLWTMEAYNHPRQRIDEYGDGHAADRIVDIIASQAN